MTDESTTRPGVSARAVTGGGPRARATRATVTARFGSGRRESHDASHFYNRFVAPELSADSEVAQPGDVDVLYHRDARDMAMVPAGSVALVVTSPPYFAGKEYEESLGHNGVPATYFEYLALLHDVFAECKRVLEPGGRIAVNVANLGRRPYRSLSGDVAAILAELGLLLRGEVVWWKGRAAGGSCAWGTFQRPSNPVLRDVTERIVIASKGRFDRALGPQTRHRLGLPSTATMGRDEFLEATTDLWEIPPESARRVGHPAPFPVELPARLIGLYTYENDVVLDPFMGSGTTAVAAAACGRHYIGFDTDARYVERATARLAAARSETSSCEAGVAVRVAAGPPARESDDRLRDALEQGRLAKDVAAVLLDTCGFGAIETDYRVPGSGLEVTLSARDANGSRWLFELAGSFATGAAGLRRADAVWKVIAKAAVVHATSPDTRFVVLTTHAPLRRAAAASALDTVVGSGRPVLDVVELLDEAAQRRLRGYASG